MTNAGNENMTAKDRSHTENAGVPMTTWGGTVPPTSAISVRSSEETARVRSLHAWRVAVEIRACWGNSVSGRQDGR